MGCRESELFFRVFSFCNLLRLADSLEAAVLKCSSVFLLLCVRGIKNF